ncbi:hypothetical protein Syun_015737 [Stephania yunnanensis]|uniref:Protein DETOXIFICATION n=1 Tax=Stephania yunnanensis TaxID=152371 RepID=A0AAP0JLX1_9MAGN
MSDELKKIGEKSWVESKKMWYIAGPAILCAVAQFSMEFVTAAFVGHLGDVELAAVSVVQNVIEGFAFGVMLGLGSALETLCGQAVGAGQERMLGIYMQRSWVIAFGTAFVLLPIYIFATQILKLLHQGDHISEVAGKYCVWVIPQLFAYALNFPLQKFFQSQSRVWVMTIMSIVVFGIHTLLTWLLVVKLGHGLVGAAIAGNISWAILVLAQLVYVVSGYFPDAWTGFSMAAFKALFGFLKLSLASAIMLCLELWYYTILILLVGVLKNPEIALDAVSICTNLHMWTLMVALGFNAAVSVRVSNELGAAQPKVAKFSVVVAVTTSLFFGLIFTSAILASGKQFPKLFTNKPLVVKETSKLQYLLAATIFLNSIQPVLHGVAIGAGWQSLIALISIVCYYVFGLPIGALLGFKFKVGVQGIWSGMFAGAFVQTLILVYILYRTNWQKEALQAEERIKKWGGPTERPETELT